MTPVETEKTSASSVLDNRCAVCLRDSVNLYKYEFGQKMSYFNWIEGIELANPNYACVYLCGTDYNLAGRVRREILNPTPARILETMIQYRLNHPIKGQIKKLAK